MRVLTAHERERQTDRQTETETETETESGEGERKRERETRSIQWEDVSFLTDHKASDIITGAS